VKSPVIAAPTACCAPIRTGIGFVLMGGTGTTQSTCDVIAFTLGAIAGAEPTIEPCDVMSQLAGCTTERAFLDQAATCGDTSAAPCRCGGTTQNSFRKMHANLFPLCDDDGPD
jgi:hypothetical protein